MPGGVSIPGIPFVQVGHNEHVAWGMTVLGGDLQDLYIEQLRQNGANTEFEAADGSWAPLRRRTERIHVRNRPDTVVDIPVTRHGAADTPIISGILPGEKRAIALRWTAYDPATLTLPFYEMNAANDWPAFSAALSTFGGPSFNLIYADDAGHIAFHAIGKMPLRGPDASHPDPISPVPVVPAPAHEWSGYIPYESLPAVVDPPTGFLATANARTTPDNYAFPITLNWGSPLPVRAPRQDAFGQAVLFPAGHAGDADRRLLGPRPCARPAPYLCVGPFAGSGE